MTLLIEDDLLCNFLQLFHFIREYISFFYLSNFTKSTFKLSDNICEKLFGQMCDYVWLYLKI